MLDGVVMNNLHCLLVWVPAALENIQFGTHDCDKACEKGTKDLNAEIDEAAQPCEMRRIVHIFDSEGNDWVQMGRRQATSDVNGNHYSQSTCQRSNK